MLQMKRITSSADRTWLDIRDCQKKLQVISRLRLIKRQPTERARIESQNILKNLQYQTDAALRAFESRKTCSAKIRKLVYGNEVKRMVASLISEIDQFDAALNRGAV